MKIVVFDSSTIINLSMNNLLYLLKDLKKISGVRLIAPPSVKYETVKHPLNIKKFKLHAIYVSRLFDGKILEMPEVINIDNNELIKRKNEIEKTANSLFFAKNKPVHLIDEGESECLALCTILNDKGIDNVLAVDERTTRVLGENSENIKKLLERKLHISISKKGDEKNLAKIKKIKFIRSTEIVYVAYKKGLIKENEKDKEILDALLYATRFKGSAISEEEIKQIKSMA